MNRTFYGALVTCFAVLIAGTSARGQVAWVTSDSSALTPGGIVTFSIGAGADFGAPAVAMPSTVVQSVSIWLAGQPVAPGQFFVSDKMLKFYCTPTRPGVATIAINLKPKSIVVPSEQAEHRLRAVYASEEIRSLWHSFPTGSAWRESRVERLRTFVRVGQPAPDERGWAKDEGYEFDILPRVDPTNLHKGEELPVRVVATGKPVGHALISFQSQDQTREHVVATDDDGNASSVLDATGGWLVRVIDVQRADGPDHDWKVRTAAMTCLVR